MYLWLPVCGYTTFVDLVGAAHVGRLSANDSATGACEVCFESQPINPLHQHSISPGAGVSLEQPILADYLVVSPLVDFSTFLTPKVS